MKGSARVSNGLFGEGHEARHKKWLRRRLLMHEEPEPILSCKYLVTIQYLSQLIRVVSAFDLDEDINLINTYL